MNICYYSDKILTPKLNCDVVFKNKEVKSLRHLQNALVSDALYIISGFKL